MHQLLTFIVNYMGFLWSDARYRIADSAVTTSNGGDSLIIVQSAELGLRFIRDRGQLFLDLQPIGTGNPKEWFSIDLVRRIFVDEPNLSAVLDESYAIFLRENLAEVERLFNDAAWPDTRRELLRIRKKRSKEMFG